METKTLRYFYEHQLSEISILDLIREGLDKDDIINTITTLYRNKDVVMSYGGGYPFNAETMSVDPNSWEAYTKNRIFNSILRGMYRSGIKKKEILLIREIMWALVKNLYSHRFDEKSEYGSYTHPASWTYVRTTRKFGEVSAETR
jgi:hypothetical protein